MPGIIEIRLGQGTFIKEGDKEDLKSNLLPMIGKDKKALIDEHIKLVLKLILK